MSDDNTSRLTRKGRATRARIVDVAARLMFEHGVAGTSIEEVRNTAAVSGSQISHYFHDKGDLTRQVIATRCNDVQEFHTQPQLGALDSLDALQSWADANIADIDAVYRKVDASTVPWQGSWSKPTPRPTTISPPATTNGLACFTPGSRRCAAEASCARTPTLGI